MKKDRAISQQFESKSNADFRLLISKQIAIINCFFVPPFVILYFVKQDYIVSAVLFVMFSCFMFKYYRSRQGKLDPYYTFVILLALVISAFVLVAKDYGLIAYAWVYPILFFLYFMLTERMAWLANALFLAVVFYFAWATLEATLVVRFIVTMSLCSFFLVAIIRIISQQHKLLQQRAIIDPLTGVHNRLILEELLGKYIDQSKRNPLPMTVAIVDIDHFKKINDCYGHDKGDETLREVAQIIVSRMRRSDNVFRIGGEEFLIFLHNTDLEQAHRFSEYLRKKIASANILDNHEITASIGLAQYTGDESLQTWMRRSDENLYKAKEAGRNRVVC